MPQIHRFTKRVKICMYADHAPPHFHLRGPGWSALIDLDTLEVVRGYAPAREVDRAVEWARGNMRVLRLHWRRLNERDG
jgi:uncharacterized protein DUF4160